MSKKWHSGPPPSIEWWPASMQDDSRCLRWWDGLGWSTAFYKGDTMRRISEAADIPSSSEFPIKWQHRPNSWPARSHT